MYIYIYIYVYIITLSFILTQSSGKYLFLYDGFTNRNNIVFVNEISSINHIIAKFHSAKYDPLKSVIIYLKGRLMQISKSPLYSCS